MPEKPRPMCRRCNRPHYNFVACAQVDAFDADQEEQRRRQANVADFNTRFIPRDQHPMAPEGQRDWGRRYGKKFSELTNGEVVAARRLPLHSINPDGSPLERVRPESPKPLAVEVAVDLIEQA